MIPIRVLRLSAALVTGRKPASIAYLSFAKEEVIGFIAIGSMTLYDTEQASIEQQFEWLVDGERLGVRE